MHKLLGILTAFLLIITPTFATANDVDPAGPIHCSPMSVLAVTPHRAPGIPLTHELTCGSSKIPARLMVGGKINLSAFTVKIKDGWREPRGQAWRIERDHAGHGGSYWKLFSATNVKTASIRVDGVIAKLY